MGARTIAYEVRFRVAGSGSNYQVRRFPVPAPSLTIKGGLVRGTSYEASVRAIGADGQPSDWVDCSFTVAAGREGAMALPPVSSGNVGSRWAGSTAVTYNATDSIATVSVSAGSLQIGDGTVSYDAASASFAGSPNLVQKVYLYYDDPQLRGGARTLGITTDAVSSVSSYGRVLITALTLNFPPPGGTSSGGRSIRGIGGGTGATEEP